MGSLAGSGEFPEGRRQYRDSAEGADNSHFGEFRGGDSPD
jgi:hypothetical protein